MKPTQILQELIKMKQEAVTELYSLYTIQTDFEYDLALERLDFRYDNEYDFTFFEPKILVMTELLKETDASIIFMQSKIEHCSHQISIL
jgi:hypothetical protein